MVDITNIVNLNITRQTRVPSVQGLSTIAILSSDANGVFGASESIRTYSTVDLLATLASDGFASTTETYKAAAIIASQSPRPENIKIIRRKPDGEKVVDITLGGAVGAGDYTLTFGGTDFEHNEPDDSRTLRDILVSLAALITANADYTAEVPAGENYIRVTGQDGDDFSTAGVAPTGSQFVFTTETEVVNAVSSLQDAQNADDDFYFVISTSVNDEENLALAAYMETITKVLFVQTQMAVTYNRTDALDSTSLLARLKALNYDHTAVLVTKDTTAYRVAAWIAGRSVVQPGSSTWKFKGGNGIAADDFATFQSTNIAAKNGNEFVAIGGTGINIFQEGVMVSGEYIDIIRGTHALMGRIQQLVLTQLTQLPKVPFTDGGIESVGLQVERGLQEYVDFGLLVGTETLDENDVSLGPNVIVPTRAETTAADRARRELKGLRFTANYAGAVHRVVINGTVSV